MKKKAVQQQPRLQEEPAYLKGNRPLLLIALSCFVIYFPTLWYDFSPMDERWLILDQRELMSHLSNLPTLFKSTMMGMYYRPVCASFFMFDMVLGNGSPFIFHFSNILLHALCAVLLFSFFRQLRISKPIAFFAAMIFAVHPINVHTVAWIPGRNDSLLCLFALLSCMTLLQYFRTKKILHFSLHIFTFTLALFTKENALVLPFVYFLLWFFFREERKWRELFLPLLAWLIIGSGWFFLRLHFVSYFPSTSTASLSKNGLNFFTGLVFYMGKIFLPIQQSVMPVLRDITILPFLLVFVAVAALSFRFGVRDKKIAAFGLCWFFIFLLIPVWAGASGTNGEMYEHRIYTSLIGAFLFLSQIKLNAEPALASRIFLFVFVLLSVKTFSRYGVYKNEMTFLEAATDESPSIALFHDMLGFRYDERGKYQEAVDQFDEAIRLSPKRIEFYNHRGNAYFQLKNYMLALDDFNKTLSSKDEQGKAITYVNRSMTNFYLGKHVEAFNDLQDARKAGAGNISPVFIRQLYASLQRDSIQVFSERIQQNPQDAEALNLRGIALLRLDQYKAALADFNKALLLKPNSEAILYNRDLAVKKMAGQMKQVTRGHPQVIQGR